jgi:hypothetical protein
MKWFKSLRVFRSTFSIPPIWGVDLGTATTEKILAVTVTKTDLNDGELHITTANFDVPENKNKTIRLAINSLRVFVSGKFNHLLSVFRRRNISRGNMKWFKFISIYFFVYNACESVSKYYIKIYHLLNW